MKNLAVIMLLVLVLISSAQDLTSQTRARRVGQTTSSPSSSPSASTQTIPSGETASGEASASSTKGAQEEVGEDQVVRVNTTLVTVPVSVTDRDGRYVADINKEDFRIFENGVQQEVVYFAAVEKPFTVVLMLDTSASTWSKLGQIKDAAVAFVEQLRPDDQVMVVAFGRGMTIRCEPTGDRQKIRKAIQGTGRGLSTHLYDAVDKVMRKHLNRIQGRKAVVLFTDGVDATSNDATYESTVRAAEELDALMYPILYDTYDPQSDTGGSPIPPSRSRLPSILRKIPLPLPIPTQGGGGSSGGGAGSSRADYDRGERYLHDLAKLTGGRVYEASKDLSQLRSAFGRIAEELRRQYSLGYYPNTGNTAGGRRHIRVRVARPNLAVRARDSYIYKPSATASGVIVNTAKDNERQSTAPVLQKKPFTVKR
ncbi:MAG: VWA domain-containing protein [Pyrinomonadaceae bacterium]|nr:VWA domain-containing protein [Pyrinomonadaceae bacterium]